MIRLIVLSGVFAGLRFVVGGSYFLFLKLGFNL